MSEIYVTVIGLGKCASALFVEMWIKGERRP